MAQLTFSEPSVKSEDNIGKELKGDVIVQSCMFNKKGVCNVIASAPEPLICPCSYFVCFRKDVVSRFEGLIKRYRCKEKIAMHRSDKVTYYDLYQLARHRGNKT